MLDLPELLQKIFQDLEHHDLTQCAQVNKQWHALANLYLWRHIAWNCLGDERRKEAFCRIVLEDYLQENGSEEEPPQPSTLSKYGHLIQLLPDPMILECALGLQACTQQGNEPTGYDLLFQLFKRSSEAQVQYIRYAFKELESDNMKSVLAFTLPRVRRLFIRASLQGTQSEFSELKRALDQCSTILEMLDVDISFLHAYEAVDMKDEAVDMKDEAAEDESICWTSLKYLTLRHITDTWNAGPLWSWMWKRCNQVEKLVVRKIDQSTPSLVQAMLAYMPKLHEISIGGYSSPDSHTNPWDEMEDSVTAALLSGTRYGWKSVSVRATAKFGIETMNTLAMHYSTLERLFVEGGHDLPRCDVVQVLRSCPHLHTLIYTNSSNGSSVVDGKAFIDLDPDTGLLKPWLCEGSLKVLTVKITGIPRPDLKRNRRKRVFREAYRGQGREIQNQLYDRLGRLTKLETLQLGDGFGTLQDSCLEMSLESGLDKLSGLKSMKELNVERSETKIGIKEVQWMVENWPKLSAIYGLDGRGLDGRRKNFEAFEWLRENRPKILVRRMLY
ncbi:MAG: hypothetical protein J3Q66DRAFT_58717 [Benniella sp.]|nr:MAG: hypothetical protein J3Q66DRAFT_58717 [Benniella sp.]